jgi:hypothetical protein
MLARVFSCAVIGLDSVVVPEVDAPEAAVIPGITVIPASTLNALYDHLNGTAPLVPAEPPEHDPETVLVETDFSGKVLEHVKQALLCARLCVRLPTSHGQYRQITCPSGTAILFVIICHYPHLRWLVFSAIT